MMTPRLFIVGAMLFLLMDVSQFIKCDSSSSESSSSSSSSSSESESDGEESNDGENEGEENGENENEGEENGENENEGEENGENENEGEENGENENGFQENAENEDESEEDDEDENEGEENGEVENEGGENGEVENEGGENEGVENENENNGTDANGLQQDTDDDPAQIRARVISECSNITFIDCNLERVHRQGSGLTFEYPSHNVTIHNTHLSSPTACDGQNKCCNVVQSIHQSYISETPPRNIPFNFLIDDLYENTVYIGRGWTSPGPHISFGYQAYGIGVIASDPSMLDEIKVFSTLQAWRNCALNIGCLAENHNIYGHSEASRINSCPGPLLINIASQLAAA